MSAKLVLTTDLPLQNKRQGKVRDIYDATLANGQEALVIVASDRISAFDVVLPSGLPGKGICLTKISNFWFDMIKEKLSDQISHHLISTDPKDIPGLSAQQVADLDGRTMIGQKCNVIPIECIVRGYVTGSGWKDYQKTGTICGLPLPKGLKECAKLPEPIFTPSTKAEIGLHDENISYDRACEIVGKPLMDKLRDLSLSIYKMAHDYAAQRGIILADTKFEFGLPFDAADGATPILIDEVLTPDSSRFWPADSYEEGRDQDSFDKQYIRNHLQELTNAGKWDKTAPGPELPQNIITNTMAKYKDAHKIIVGTDLDI